jgi:serine/threonine protein kinase
MAQTFHRYRAGDKPVGGYKLIRKLGEGGFGEVWQASAPGGAEVALKFIDLTGQQGFREFKSLRLVKKITHNNLTPLHGFWLKNEDGTLIDESDVTWSQLAPVAVNDPSSSAALATAVFTHPVELIVAMGLGKKSLYDRLRECKDENLAGIPADELLEYMEDAARGIDYLNRPIHDMGHGPVPIVHSDVKPHNILIVGDGAQVCDFGLAHAVEALRKTCAAPLTLAYAAPESFRGKPSDKSDQYSLAITYVELRTGALPFDESLTGYEVMTAHVQGQLDYSRLLPGEESVIRRATAAMPQDRWRNCREMVIELRKALRLSTDSNFMPDAEAIPDAQTRKSGPPLTHTMMPPGTAASETAPYSGLTPTDRDPSLRTRTPQTLMPRVVPGAVSQSGSGPRRKVSTRARLLVSLLLLAGISGAVGYSLWNKETNFNNSNGGQNNGGNQADIIVQTDDVDPSREALDLFNRHRQRREYAKAAALLRTEADELARHDPGKLQRDLVQEWRAYADDQFSKAQTQSALRDARDQYAGLAAWLGDAPAVQDLHLMQARVSMALRDDAAARGALGKVPEPSGRQTPRDKVFHLVKLVLDADSAGEGNRIDQLHSVSTDRQGSKNSSAHPATDRIWQVTAAESKRFEEAQADIIGNWLKAALADRGTAEGLARLKKDGLQTLNKILAIDNGNADALALKADLHLTLEQWKDVGSAVEQLVALGTQPTIEALRERARLHHALHRLTSLKSDEQSLQAALGEVPELMQRFKDAESALARGVSDLAERSDKYSQAAIGALREAAERPESQIKPLFALLLAKDIKARLSKESNFKQKAAEFLKDCQFVTQHGGASDEIIRACQAEALLELNPAGALAALGSAGTSPYYLFVKALVLSRDPRAAEEGRSVLQALFKTKPTAELRQSGRVAAAFELVDRLVKREELTTEFNIQTALKAPQASTFGTLHEILAGAQAWSDATTKLSEPARARLAIAAWWHPQLKNEALARTLTEELVSSWRSGSDEKLDPSLVYRLYFTYLAAHRGSTERSTQEAMLAVADRLMSLTKATKLDNARAQAFYRAIVVPFQGTAESLKNDAFFAGAADLVGAYPGLDWGVTDAGKHLHSNEIQEQLYTKAIQLSAAPKFSYHVKRGQVRLNRKPFDLDLVLEDAKTLDRDPQFRDDAQLLRGQGYFTRSRDEQTNAARLNALNQALKELQATVTSSGKRESSDEEEARRLLLLSFVHLERRNFAGRFAGAANDFQNAADYAHKALEFLPRSDHKLAYGAAGNAYEDLAWFAGVEKEENYKKAVQNFQYAVDADPNSSLAHMNLGRCYYKMAAVSGVGLGKPLQSIIAQAETELTKAVKLAEPQGNAEAHYWLAKARQVKHLTDRLPVETAKTKLNDKEFHAADNELIRAVELAVAQDMPKSALRVFVVEFAESVLLHPSFYSRDEMLRKTGRVKVNARIDQLRNYHLPRTVGVDMDQEIRLLKARATRLIDSGVAALNELDATAAALRKTEIDRTTASDAKLMEFRLSIFDELRRDERTPALTETRLKDAIWYARLPLANRRKHAVPVLDAARKEAESAKLSDTSTESIFARYRRDWLKAAILSLPVNERANDWYRELLPMYATEVQLAGDTKAAAAKNRVAEELDHLAADLQSQNRAAEAKTIKERADSYRSAKPQAGAPAKTNAKVVSQRKG